jgi:hypothetical protein
MVSKRCLIKYVLAYINYAIFRCYFNICVYYVILTCDLSNYSVKINGISFRLWNIYLTDDF